MIPYLNFPINVKWYITSKCNLRCKHCYLTDYTRQPKISEILPIVEYLGLKGVNGIAFLGGEPLVRGDLEIIIRTCSNSGIKTKIATNGILVTESRARALIDSGCSAFQVSLEGHEPELSDPVRGANTFNKIIEGARILKSSGSWVSLAFTISRVNAASIDEMCQLAIDTKIDQLKLAPFIPVGTGAELANAYSLDRDTVTYVRERLEIIANAHPNLKINSVFMPPDSNNKKCISCSSSMGCGAGTYNLVINSDLSLSPCDMLVEEDRTSSPISKPEDIEDAWNRSPIFKKWRGQIVGSTRSIPTFEGVHKNGCHLAYSAYRENLFV